MRIRRILLVEDNRDHAELTIRALRKSNVANEVKTVYDGEEALNYMFGRGAYAGRDVHDLPAVILLDLKLPKVDGMDVLKQVRADERTKLVPVVILTSSKEERDVINGYRLGANAYVQKAVDFVRFSEAVKSLGLFWAVLNEPPPAV
jgi:DNA-binding response OmpR family regulator